MKYLKFLCALLLLAGLAPPAMAERLAIQQVSFSTTTSGNSLRIVGTGINYHKMHYNPIGTVSTCTVKIEQSANNSSWSDLIAGTTCTSAGASVATAGSANYIRITVTVLSGGGTVSVRWEGYSGNPDGTGGGAVTQSGTWTVQPGNTANTTPWLVDTTPASPVATEYNVIRASDGTNFIAPDSSANPVWTKTNDVCSGAKIFVPINQITGTQLITGTASNRTYVCHINIVTATAQNIALVSGTGSVCATSTGPMMGGTTAATGWNLAANGGIAAGGGTGAIAKSDTDADNICLLQSSTGQISGVITYVVAPN